MKKVTLTLVGLDGNAFSLLGAFSRAAKRQGWTKEEIEEVMKEAKSGDYDHLLRTLVARCEDAPPQEQSDAEYWRSVRGNWGSLKGD